MSGIFSGDVTDLSRIGLWGLIVTAVGLVVFFAGPKLFPQKALAAKLIGLLITVVGALGAMKII